MAALDTQLTLADLQQVEVDSDVVVGRGGARDLLCDIYRPIPGRSKQTAIIHLHGGGFRRGSRAGARLARPLAARGYTCLSSSYRLSDEARWPAQVQDAKAAIRWARAHAGHLGVEANRVVVLGYSAGAHLALIAAGSQNRADFEGDGGNAGAGTDVAACIAFYPPAEFRRGQGGPAAALLGADATDEAYRRFSPIDYVQETFPPTMLLHGTADLTLPVDGSIRLAEALRKVGAAVELHVFEGMTHIFDAHPDMAHVSADLIDLFLDRHVVNPRVYPSTEPAPRA